MPLPTGTWTIVLYGPAGGQGNLDIAVNNAGNLSGSTVFGDQVVGLWNESQQTIAFMRVQALPATFQTYSGYLFSVPTRANEIHYTLAGNFEIYSPAGQAATASANTYQWLAYIDIKTKEGKDSKEHKDKDKDKDKDHPDKLPPDKLPEVIIPDEEGLRGQMHHGASGESHHPSGHAFIRSEERPPVGEQALQ